MSKKHEFYKHEVLGLNPQHLRTGGYSSVHLSPVLLQKDRQKVVSRSPFG